MVSCGVGGFDKSLLWYWESPVPEIAEILTSESVEGSSLSLQGIDDIHSGDSLPLGMLTVGHGIPNHVLQKDLQDTSSLLVDQSADSLHSSPPCKSSDGGLGDSLDVIT